VLPETSVEIAAGPPIARAPNDVGGLLDTSKGWTLDFTEPRETIASRDTVEQQQLPAQASADDGPTGPAPALASR
jgi:hypothetical protein